MYLFTYKFSIYLSISISLNSLTPLKSRRRTVWILLEGVRSPCFDVCEVCEKVCESGENYDKYDEGVRAGPEM